MERKADAERAKLAHLERVHGEGKFTGVDNEGRPYKDVKMDGIANPQYSEEQSQKMQKLI
jgi:hypothetical protein